MILLSNNIQVVPEVGGCSTPRVQARPQHRHAAQVQAEHRGRVPGVGDQRPGQSRGTGGKHGSWCPDPESRQPYSGEEAEVRGHAQAEAGGDQQ